MMKIKSTISVLMLILLISDKIFATGQYCDKFIFKGKEYRINDQVYPLEDYFEKYPGKRPEGTLGTTALWRRYSATFEIKDSVVFLKDIEVLNLKKNIKAGEDDQEWESVIKKVFPNRLKIDWLTKLLVLPYGKIVKYRILGTSTSGNYILLDIRNGRLIKVSDFTLEQYDAFNADRMKNKMGTK